MQPDVCQKISTISNLVDKLRTLFFFCEFIFFHLTATFLHDNLSALKCKHVVVIGKGFILHRYDCYFIIAGCLLINKTIRI
jgi:hypothetical protein